MADLRRAGYSESRGNPMGYLPPARRTRWRSSRGRIPTSTRTSRACIKFSGGRIAQIVSLADNTARGQFQLEPQLITNLFDRNREKRRLIRFADIPPVLVNAITSAEDKRFFQHAGFDPIRHRQGRSMST